jgi:hypothetical protein
VHSALVVGLESAKMMGRGLAALIAANTFSSNAPPYAQTTTTITTTTVINHTNKQTNKQTTYLATQSKQRRRLDKLDNRQQIGQLCQLRRVDVVARIS